MAQRTKCKFCKKYWAINAYMNDMFIDLLKQRNESTDLLELCPNCFKLAEEGDNYMVMELMVDKWPEQYFTQQDIFKFKTDHFLHYKGMKMLREL